MTARSPMALPAEIISHAVRSATGRSPSRRRRRVLSALIFVPAVLIGWLITVWGAAAAPPAPWTCGPADGPAPAYATSEWSHAGHGPVSDFGQGAYVRPSRIQHVPIYRLRVDDVLELVYRRTRDEVGQYRLNVGDRIRVESLADDKLNRELVIQPDGTITLPILEPVRAKGLTTVELKNKLEDLLKKYYKIPTVTVTPLQTDTKLIDVINTVDSRAGSGGQVRVARIVPDGTIALPAIGSVSAIGLTLDELKQELGNRYRQIDVDGIEVQPILQQRAPRFVFVLGEVRQPGRHVLEGPTTVIQAIALAGGITSSAAANLQQVVVLRRRQDWQMIATMVDLYGPIVKGRAACAAVNDLWTADSDIIIVPKTKILVLDEFIELIFTRGIYGVLPVQGVSLNFAKNSTL